MEDLITTITASILAIALTGIGLFFFIKYGIEECKENRIVRRELIKYLKKQNKDEE